MFVRVPADRNPPTAVSRASMDLSTKPACSRAKVVFVCCMNRGVQVDTNEQPDSALIES